MNKEQQAIARLRLAAEMSETYYHAPARYNHFGRQGQRCVSCAGAWRQASGTRYSITIPR